MDKITLDVGTLLGFRIVVGAEGASVLRSPKIGDKTCPTINQDVTPDIRVDGERKRS